jgi:GAF domain-containing protein
MGFYPAELEIKEEQRAAGLQNPLTEAQVEWVNNQVRQELIANRTFLNWDNPQEIAMTLLPQGANLMQVAAAVEVF